ncbi:DapH/DapD/GlmU-related protein [Corynebacterium halotolerans]|uniref:DapH/DapD/GlmU-related protein n=1 Tax=Corynebacterium halotolerans TaxID=225326 RepID=UPI003CEE664F
MTKGAQAIGIANISIDGTVLDTWFPAPELIDGTGLRSGTVRLGAQELSKQMLSLVTLDEDRMVEQVAVRTTIADLSAGPVSAHDVYLRLHLLSHRLVTPLSINMDPAARHLANVVWTNKGPSTSDNFEFVRTSLRSRGLIHVYGIDHLPRMVDYALPDGVRIAEAERVRLGAYLAPGTTVLREGFVSYNAGSLGPSRIEGRLSSGVTIGAGCNVGLSATLMAERGADGTRIPLTIGENCDFGVSSGLIGISIGDNCRIGANIIIERDSPIHDADRGQVITGAELEGRSNWSVRTEAGHAEPVLRCR